MNNNPSITWFDRLATEVIFDILDYLSSNDIIYTFFYFNQRFNNLLLQNQRYLSHIQTSITNIHFCKNIIPIIKTQIQCLVINTNNFSYPLSFFPNLKSLIISTSFPFDYDQLYSLIETKQFQNLTSFKIQSEILSKNSSLTYPGQFENTLFKKIFNNANSLQTFQYSSKTPLASFGDNLSSNLNLHSLSLNVYDFASAFSLLYHTPNLKSLDFLIETPYVSQQFHFPDIKLEKFSLTFFRSNYGLYGEKEFLILTNLLKQFSSSLISLSLNFSNLLTNTIFEYFFNGNRLELQLLESIVKLKQFHFYAKLDEYGSDTRKILLTFQNQFWYDHQWFVATDEYYLYTLPFHFDSMKSFTGFDRIKSMNSESPEIGHHVKSIELSKFDLNLIKKLKLNMPKLKSIEFKTKENPFHNENITNTTLDNVTTLHFSKELLNYVTPWLINVLPNLKYLVLTYSEFSTSGSILNKITGKFKTDLEQLAKNDFIYFSKIQEIRIIIFDEKFHYQNFREKEIINLFKTLENLKNLSFHIHCYRVRCCLPEEIKKKFKSNQYELNCYKNYIQFVKKDVYIKY
jgi:hypothetical protein